MNPRILGLALLLLPALPAAAVEPATGGGCSDACNVDDGPTGLTEQAFRDTITAWLDEPMAAPSLPLETLLFYGESAVGHLAGLDLLPLDAGRRAFLARELSRTQVQIEMRLVDDAGEVRAHLAPDDIPLAEKQHLRLEGTGTLGHLETGGQIKRVGLAHLWTRW